MNLKNFEKYIRTYEGCKIISAWPPEQDDNEALRQLRNMAKLPGLAGPPLGMPDMHRGYGFPIGGVAAFDAEDGIILPGGVGYDINCGVRVLVTELSLKQDIKKISDIVQRLYSQCPAGVGKGSYIQVNRNDMTNILRDGIKWAVAKGFAEKEDMQSCEDGGSLPGRAEYVSSAAIERGVREVGSLGAGNHFFEVDVIHKVYEEKTAAQWGLFPGGVVIQIHCGSRGLGHQVCTDYLRMFRNKGTLPVFDKKLVYAPMRSAVGEKYFGAMSAAGNFAYVNRQILSYMARTVFRSHAAGKLRLLYDVTHNMAKIEEHTFNGRTRRIIVHRKGATRCFPTYRMSGRFSSTGQPVLVPGSMGTASWILKGRDEAMEVSLGSCCHGAGRVMSRHEARKRNDGYSVVRELQKSGITVYTQNMKSAAEEAPSAYKNIDMIIEAVTGARLADKIASLKPVAVIKG